MGLYSSTAALCRTIIDSAVDICVEQVHGEKIFNENEKKPCKKMKLASEGNPNLFKKMDRLYNEFSRIIHGNKTSTPIGDVFITFKVVEELFDHNFAIKSMRDN